MCAFKNGELFNAKDVIYMWKRYFERKRRRKSQWIQKSNELKKATKKMLIYRIHPLMVELLSRSKSRTTLCHLLQYQLRNLVCFSFLVALALPGPVPALQWNLRQSPRYDLHWTWSKFWKKIRKIIYSDTLWLGMKFTLPIADFIAKKNPILFTFHLAFPL